MATKSRSKTMVMEPVLLKNDIEISLHCLLKSSSVYKELCVMFPDINEERCDNSTNISIFDNHERFFVIPTCQKSNYDLIQIGVEIEKEKDRLLLTFTQFARDIIMKCEALGLWCDYIDPCSGYPMVHTDTNKTYDEVDNIQKLLKYRTLPANCCRVLHHPAWGSAVYPASIFIYIPQTVEVPCVPSKGAGVLDSSIPDTVFCMANSAVSVEGDCNSSEAMESPCGVCLQFVVSRVLRDYIPTPS